MKDTKHTPGPWMANRFGQIVDLSREGLVIGVVYAEKNKTVVATAPELFKALEQFSMLNEDHDDFKSIKGLILNARQVTNKAKGL